MPKWVPSRLWRAPATLRDEDKCLDIGALPSHAEGTTAFVFSFTVIPQRERRSCDGIAVDDCGALPCVKLHPWQDRMKGELGL